MRKVKREVTIGNLTIGGHNPVAVQTMLNVRADDVAGNVAQAVRVAEAGCQIVRVSVPTLEDVRLIEAIKNAVDIPLVADIHFNHRIALACADAGVDKIRLNPGNIGGDDHVKEVAAACKAKNIPIRIGVNAGSLEKEVLAKYGAPVPEALVESAMYHVSLLEKYDFDNIVISIKSSNVPRMMEAYRLLSERCDYPLHVGVTEAGTYRMGLIKSAIGIVEIHEDPSLIHFPGPVHRRIWIDGLPPVCLMQGHKGKPLADLPFLCRMDAVGIPYVEGDGHA